METTFSSMPGQPESSGSPQSENLPTPNPHSCTICRQRKVRCDKQKRCSNCAKAGVECVYTVPVRPRCRRGIEKSPEQELLRRLKQYEFLLRKHGVRLDDRDAHGSNGPEPEPSSNGTRLAEAPRGEKLIYKHVPIAQ